MTFSIVARCEDTGQFGIAVSSSSPAVASRCAFARAGVGAVASQNITDPTLGDACLNLMSNALTAQQAIDQIAANTPHIEYRQLSAVDLQGNSVIPENKRLAPSPAPTRKTPHVPVICSPLNKCPTQCL
jgi:uncharacterized Ntn-hydrolase superfamily protein